MNSFFNDHLVPPILCEILYATVPEELHLPVVLLQRPLTRDGRRYPRGCLLLTEPRHIETYLNAILSSAIHRQAVAIAVPVFGMWYQLLHTAYHEFGHVYDLHSWNAPEGAYGNTSRETTNEEIRANAFAEARVAHLAELDRRVFQPQWLSYLSIRLWKHFVGARKWPWGSRTNQWLHHIRWVKSGGQLTARDVADHFCLTRVKSFKLFEDEAPLCQFLAAARKHRNAPTKDSRAISKKISKDRMMVNGKSGPWPLT